MRMGYFFIDRPVFAIVLSVFITVVGALAYFTLPVKQYPEVAPPTIVVTATYPGASPEVIADTVATPIEQEVNGIEGMLYMSSQSTDDGRMQLTITFELGTDLDVAQVLVQNRVAIAEPRLPEEVRRLGITTRKSSPDLMMVVHLLSPDASRDQLYVSNYALLQIRDVLARLEGVGDITVFGAREYSMRVWLDPERMASFSLTAGDVVNALRQQNVQVAGGALGQPPMPLDSAFQLTVNTQGRFVEPEQFADVVVKTGDGGRVTRVRDIARVELGARDYVTNSYLNGQPAVAIVIFQRPGTNALDAADDILRTMDELSVDFPDGIEHRVVYNPTEFIQQSIDAVVETIFEAVALVVLVVILFLQKWRAALIPILAIPVSLIGTFAVMSIFGNSLNTLSLFGLVLAIGIVVDDAIVVVENIERNLENGMDPHDAARKTMQEVGGAIIATSLVLVAVFVPTAFISGISGQFYQQFAMTIAAATVISTLNSLSLSPSLGAILLKPRENGGAGQKLWDGATGWFFTLFNRGFGATTRWYSRVICNVVRKSGFVLVLYGGLLALTYYNFNAVPTGFIPEQDQGYVIVAVQLPDGASLERTDDVILRATDLILDTPGVSNAVAFTGFSGATRTNASNAGAIFVTLKPFKERAEGENAFKLVGQLWGKLGTIQEAQIFVIAPPPVRGLGTAGGFKVQIQDKSGKGYHALKAVLDESVNVGWQNPTLERLFSTFSTSKPQFYAEIDRVKAEMLDVPVENVFEALEVFLGSSFVNDFNLFGRTYRVIAQADAEFRLEPSDIGRLRARSETGAMVPLGSLVELKAISGPDRVVRYNLFPAAEINGSAAEGFSSGEAIAAMEGVLERTLPNGFGFEWTDIAFQEIRAGNTAHIVFGLSVLFVLLALAAQYESWSLPFAIVLIVPMCLLSGMAGVMYRGLDNNIMVQIGFVVLVGLATKNAILIVEFAKQLQDEGKNRFDAAIEACRLRLRPIVMTSFAFILGVVPLLVAQGAGAEMRQALGTSVFSGMLGVTFFGLFLTPVFYVVIQGFKERKKGPAPEPNCQDA